MSKNLAKIWNEVKSESLSLFKAVNIHEVSAFIINLNIFQLFMASLTCMLWTGELEKKTYLLCYLSNLVCMGSVTHPLFILLLAFPMPTDAKIFSYFPLIILKYLIDSNSPLSARGCRVGVSVQYLVLFVGNVIQ